jgi:hypothetical protein
LLFINEIFPTELTDISKSLLKKFDSVKFLKVSFQNSTISDFPDDYSFYVILGLKDQGVFPGSRIDTCDQLGWEHCAIEAWRHLLIFKSYKNTESELSFPFNRIIYFGSNGIPDNLNIKKDRKLWPKPVLQLCKPVPTLCENVFVWRSLLENYIGWDKGSHARFVY